MLDPFDGGSDFRKSFDELFAELTKKNREALEEFLDFQKVVVEDYGKYIDDELSHDNEVLKHFGQILIEQTAVVLKASRTNRTNVRELHARLVDTHVKFIDHLKAQLNSQKAPKSSQAQKQPSAPSPPNAPNVANPPNVASPPTVAKPPRRPKVPQPPAGKRPVR